MNIANALERALYIEAVIRVEEEEQTPQIAATRRYETEVLKDSVNRLVQHMFVGNENIVRSSDGRRNNSHWGVTRRDGNRYREKSSRDGVRTITPALNIREGNDNPRRKNNITKSTMWAKEPLGKELP